MNFQELRIMKLGAGDLSVFEKLIDLFREIFEMEDPDAAARTYLGELLEKPGFSVYAATYQSEVVGGLTAYELPLYYSEGSEVYIYDIAVTTAHQRKGIGKALLSALLEDCRRGRITTLFVDADQADEHALDFYHSTGGKAAEVIQFTYSSMI
jgi:aminoglycoside 3-N-acetyltransferase I